MYIDDKSTIGIFFMLIITLMSLRKKKHMKHKFELLNSIVEILQLNAIKPSFVIFFKAVEKHISLYVPPFYSFSQCVMD